MPIGCLLFAWIYRGKYSFPSFAHKLRFLSTKWGLHENSVIYMLPVDAGPGCMLWNWQRCRYYYAWYSLSIEDNNARHALVVQVLYITVE